MKLAISLFLFQADPAKAVDALAQGVDAVIFDVEQRGKRERQRTFDTSISVASIDALPAFVADSRISPICRLDPWGETSPRQIDVAIEAGVSALILPMAKTLEEVDGFTAAIGGRTKAGLMVETPEMLLLHPHLAHRELNLVYVGLHDLAIARNDRNLFAPLIDGTVEWVREALPNVSLGVAGATDPRFGAPIPFPLLAAEMSRLGIDFTFLRRSFITDVPASGIRTAVESIRALWRALAQRSAHAVLMDRLRFSEAVAAAIEE